ncbi:NnrU family protein [uncultured Roseovarius sp.]|uniref:NnrU family protein n=1 Tax=uncultured Roseovarius sp. TaxID=293344 RepID=UPI000C94B02C|nr:NnrU family protein [Roseovarius sp.]|tara:strand:- start:3146 stop:3808 length:663 start_codon:yes stop_codon:yes gene_type:complete
MGWAEFIAAFAVFFLSHSVPLRPNIKAPVVARVGAGGFTLGYSILSLAVLAWVIGAAGRAPYVPLWGWAAWQGHVTLAVMLGVCVILGLSIGRPNPFSFGGAQNARFDPGRPGIVRLTRHPLLLALALWAVAHMLPNGDLAHVILFGSFAGFAIGGMWIVDRRKRRGMGAEWLRLDHARRQAGIAPRSWGMACVRGLLGSLLYAGLLAAHPLLFGVSPLG